MKNKTASLAKRILSSKKGVIILEYMLLLIVCVGCAFMIMELVEIAETKEDSGSVIKAWMKAVEVIAEDM